MVAQASETQRVNVTVEHYVEYHSAGFLIFRGLIPQTDIDELVHYTDELMERRAQGSASDDRTTGTGQYIPLEFLHRHEALHERYMLHPRILDVVEALIGPDVTSVQDMLFLKGPGAGGEGYHQDAYSVPTVPETLIGAWLAIDRSDEENGCLWMANGSHVEPVYPGDEDARGGADYRILSDLPTLSGLSNPTEGANDLGRIAERYPHVAAVMDPGDVAFFGGRCIHWSGPNRSSTRTRRAFVGHYCNAHSIIRWDHDDPSTREIKNHLHILARGETHLPYAQPRFGTVCAASERGT